MNTESQQSDEELVRRLLRRDEDAFTSLYRKCCGAVYRFALYMTGDPHSAEEITQDTFIFLLANASLYDVTRGSLVAWLLGVARNGSRRLLATRGEADALDNLAELEIPDDGDLFEEFARRELIEAVRCTIGSLPPALREVVILCELQELEYKEAAAVLGCPIGTVRSRLNRARGLLVSKLKMRCPAWA